MNKEAIDCLLEIKEELIKINEKLDRQEKLIKKYIEDDVYIENREFDIEEIEGLNLSKELVDYFKDINREINNEKDLNNWIRPIISTTKIEDNTIIIECLNRINYYYLVVYYTEILKRNNYKIHIKSLKTLEERVL
ncbi:hypothetical protein LQE93_15630 [Clostridium sp. NSJ-145]|uniref:hypothetical protein n=1 Tax=Clostridium sp. NSJ-145 TaxID=2897777 RepID=UPI001E5380D3|nr:hypothetical protein [Clostridium sp. NSJ-145]MCD2503191.1 hypothetical protein [Clostridium sp. NSJ-145]